MTTLSVNPLNPKSEPQEDFASNFVEVQIMDEATYGDGDGSGSGADNMTMKKLLDRVQLLERQIASCLENQPLLYQVFNKCNRLEQRLKAMKKDVDKRLSKGVISNEEEMILGGAIYDDSMSDNEDEFEDDGDEFVMGQDPEDSEFVPDVAYFGANMPLPTSTSTRMTTRRSENGSKQDKKKAPLLNCKVCGTIAGFNTAEALAQHYTTYHATIGVDQTYDGPLDPDTADAATSIPPRAQGCSCPECEENFTSNWAMNRHRDYKHLAVRFPCNSCDRQFKRTDKLYAHQRFAHGEITRVSAVSTGIRQSRRTLGPPLAKRRRAPRKCTTVPPRRGSTNGGTDTEPELPEVLPSWSTRNSTSSNLQFQSENSEPMATGSGSVPVQVSIADSGSEGARVEFKPKPGSKTCPKCQGTFKNFWSTKRHLISVCNPGSDSTAFECGVCQKVFNRKDKVTEHQKNVHGEVSQILTSARALTSKTPSSTDPKSHVCEACGITFNRADSLRTHKLIHAPERPFKCPYCDKGFNQRNALKSHVVLHTGKPHICDECGWSFSRPYYLNMHKKNHLKGTARTLPPENRPAPMRVAMEAGPSYYVRKDGKLEKRRFRPYKRRQLKPKPLLPITKGHDGVDVEVADPTDAGAGPSSEVVGDQSSGVQSSLVS